MSILKLRLYVITDSRVEGSPSDFMLQLYFSSLPPPLCRQRVPGDAESGVLSGLLLEVHGRRHLQELQVGLVREGKGRGGGGREVVGGACEAL